MTLVAAAAINTTRAGGAAALAISIWFLTLGYAAFRDVDGYAADWASQVLGWSGLDSATLTRRGRALGLLALAAGSLTLAIGIVMVVVG